MLTHVRLCLAPVEFTLRNHSLSHPSRYVIRLGAISGEKLEQSQVLLLVSWVLLAHPPVAIFFHLVIQESLRFEAYCIPHNRRPQKRNSGLPGLEHMRSQGGKSKRLLETQAQIMIHLHGVRDIVTCKDPPRSNSHG